ncbi:hypothetical protein BU15DRAFT_39687 [Melanogaster broomeanus]|nr:hypothetical protein BU15DRAFT_39687 [Melanogaster broomeanus]
MLTSEAKSTPVKGKARDDGRWNASWWDFHPLVENINRPVDWSCSSTIFTTHPTQPVILGRLFPSSKQFVVVSPDPILRSPTSYEPPTVITVSPNDQWLFAFYPSRDGDGIACLWSRGSCVDTWMVRECWPFSRGSGVVTAAWAGAEREWTTSTDGSSSRLPSRGPLTPVSNPTLLLVTQAHQLHVCYLRTYVPSRKVIFCSLTQPYFTVEGQPLGAMHDTPAGPKTSRLCIRAAIGFIYNAACNDLGLGLPLDLPQSQDPSPEEQYPPLNWGAQAEEQTIELCEVKLRFDGMNISLISQPLPPLHHPSPHLTGLTFVCTPPPKPDPTTSPRTSPKKDKQPGRPMTEPPATFLVASFLDFEDYSTVPKSVIVAYTLARTPPAATPIKIAWTTHHVGERSFFPRVLTLSCPGWVPTNVRKGVVVALLADTGGSASRGTQKAREVAVGNIAILQLPDLADDPDWERLLVSAPASRAGMDWPVNIAMSRNRVLLCAVALGRMSIHTLPKQLVRDPTPHNLLPLSMALSSAIQSRRSVADIAHVLSMSATPFDTIVDTMKGTWFAFETNARAGMVGAFSAMEVLGATVEIYRWVCHDFGAKARQTAEGDEKEHLSSLWRNAHDMCSVAACLTAFEDCKESEGYDLDAVWQLVSLSGWVVRFLEKLVKECLSLADLTDPESAQSEVKAKLEPVDDADPFLLNGTSRHPLSSPILLHVVHPLTLSNLIGVVVHMNRFYHSLSSLTPKRENSQIVRDTLVDLIGCSGLNLKGLEDIFKAAVLDVRSIHGDEARMSLSKCHPVPTQHAFLRKMIQTLYTSTAIDKPRLFIKPADLVDGFANLSTSDQPQQEQDRDVVTKGLLLRRGPGLLCLRCGHRSELGGEVTVAGHVSLRWRTWEKVWATRCVCGGAWVSGNI